MEDDLKLCAVKPVTDSDRRFCFEVISPTKSHILQADSEVQYQAWIKALQSEILKAFEGNRSSSVSGPSTQSTSLMAPPANRTKVKKVNWRAILMIPGNMKCADCGNSDVKWASINLGITLCISCSGVHRSLGVQVSKVRGLTLDTWEPEILRVMMELGNEVVNKVYEATYDDLMSDIERATENCDDDIRKKWIIAKYTEKKFVLPLCDNKKTELLPPNLLPSPSKWSVKKYRRRAARRFVGGLEEVRGDQLSLHRHIINNNDTKITSKEHDNSGDEKEVNESILVLGDRFIDSSYSGIPESCNLFTASDQESTSGEEDVLGEFGGILWVCQRFDGFPRR
jgi:Arf-GAP with coiled-coil, ANK repeat and PH domain-containing protein